VREAVELEEAFVAEALRVDLIGMNARLMGQYVEFVADRWAGGGGRHGAAGSVETARKGGVSYLRGGE
jgi:hypothetical protein